MKDIEFNFLELKKFNKTEKQLKTVLDKWTYFLKASNLDNYKIPEDTESYIKEAYEIVEMHNWSKQELETYENIEKARMDFDDKMTTNFRKGKQE